MKKSLNEVKKLQKLAGILVNENLFDSNSSGDSQTADQDTTQSNIEKAKNKVDTASELVKQLMNVRQLVQSADIKLDTKEIAEFSNIIDLIINKANQGNAGNQIQKAVNYTNSITGNIGPKSEG